MVALGRCRQEGHNFEASLDYRVRPCLKKKNRKKSKKQTTNPLSNKLGSYFKWTKEGSASGI
jgi:hypothetical protein